MQKNLSAAIFHIVGLVAEAGGYSFGEGEEECGGEIAEIAMLEIGLRGIEGLGDGAVAPWGAAEASVTVARAFGFGAQRELRHATAQVTPSFARTRHRQVHRRRCRPVRWQVRGPQAEARGYNGCA